jgi:glutathione S-transferase
VITLCGFGVSNYYNKLKLLMLEKGIPFTERLMYPWQRDAFLQSSPLGKIPFIETEFGGLSESQAIAEFLEERFPGLPMYPADLFERAKCREIIQHLELNCEWVARRLYREAFFGGRVSHEVKEDVRVKLISGLKAVGRLSKFSPYILGDRFTAADCAAFIHFTMITLATQKIYGDDFVASALPQAADFLRLMNVRPHVQAMMRDRTDALAAFARLNVQYDG